MNEIRDPIYGFIKPSDTELKIINSSLLQRLRRIKQLAMANLVYPGANHTRFDHSLGVYHIASLMADILLPGEEFREKRNIIRYSALLHDVGHGPFSHVSEAVLNKFFKSEHEEKIHEQITQRLIESDSELKNILSPSEIGMVIGLLNGNKMDYSIMKEIVSGPLDADKMDYLLRDSYFCGVKYGIFDLHRLINTLESYRDGIDKHIAIKYDGLNSLEQFVLAKYYMTRQVYRHKVRILSDSMIVRGLELGIEKDDIPFLPDLFKFREDADYLTNYLKFYDDKILNDILFSGKRGYAFEIFNRLYQRRLFKRVFSEKLNRIPIAPLVRDQLININKNEKLRKNIEERISQLDILKCDKNYVIVNSFKFKSVKEMSKDDNEGKLIIKTKDDTVAEFQDESMVFNSISESLNEVYFEVYAPVEFETALEKEKKLNEFKIKIMEILEELKDQEG
jgi:HD superfamily phosphohydrolase